jgi:hypothetical protein
LARFAPSIIMDNPAGWVPEGGWKTKPTLEVPPQGKRKKREPEPEPAPLPQKIEVTREAVTSVVVVSMSFLATTVDESFTVLDEKHKPLPHVEEAITNMMPWMALYGDWLIKAIPWFGLGAGIMALAAPAVDPVTEIIAGVRKPRISRTSKDDIYTDRYRAHLEKMKAKQEEENKRNGEPKLVEQK